MQFEDGIGERIWNARAGERRANRPEDYTLGLSTGDDESTDTDIIARLNE